MGKNLKLVGIGIIGIIGLAGVIAPKAMASSYGNCETGWGCLKVKKMAGAKPGQEWGLESGDFGSFFHGSFGSQVKIILEEDEEVTDKEKLMGLMKAIQAYQDDSEVSSEDKQKMINALKKIGKIKLESKHSGGLVLDDELYAALKAQMFDRTGKKGLKVERTDVANDLDITGLGVENMKSLINRTDGYLLVKKIYPKVIKVDSCKKADLIVNQLYQGLSGVSTSMGWPHIAVDAGIVLGGSATSDISKVKIPWRPAPWNNWTITIDKVEKANSKLLTAHGDQITAENILATWDITLKDNKGAIKTEVPMDVEMTIRVPTGTEEIFKTGNYFIYNRHGDTSIKIEGASYDAITKTLKFVSRKFSEFTITNKSTSGSVVSVLPPSTPSTPPVAGPVLPAATEPAVDSSNTGLPNSSTNANIGTPNAGSSSGENIISIKKAVDIYNMALAMLGLISILALFAKVKFFEKK